MFSDKNRGRLSPAHIMSHVQDLLVIYYLLFILFMFKTIFNTFYIDYMHKSALLNDYFIYNIY